jgi:hypothetical protein
VKDGAGDLAGAATVTFVEIDFYDFNDFLVFVAHWGFPFPLSFFWVFFCLFFVFDEAFLGGLFSLSVKIPLCKKSSYT